MARQPSDSNKLAPVGEVVELLVGGPALADGYLGQPEKTAAVFLKPPLWLPPSPPDEHPYRSGDLVQYTTNGELRYISRKDSQVKIRGMRVELAEVEYHIRQADPHLNQAIVEASTPKNSNGIPLLVAFLHSADKEALSGKAFSNMVEKIKHSVSLVLPDYMRPGAYVPLESVPVTISKKVDRKSLKDSILTSTREELEGHQAASASIVTGETDLERLTLQLVSQVLKLEPASVGLGHNFVSLGGDSITAMMLVNRLMKSGYKTTVGTLLAAKTLSDIVILIQSHVRPVVDARPQNCTKGDAQGNDQMEANSYLSIPRLVHVGPTEQSFSQARMWFLQQMEPASTWLLLPHATRLRGELSLEALKKAVSVVVEHQEALRTRFMSRNGIGFQVVSSSMPSPWEVVDMSSASNEELMSSIHKQQNTPMDLTEECWRVVIFRLSPTEHVLSIVLHHIIADGWSFDIFVKSMARYYNALVRGQSLVDGEAPPKIQYRDFTVWQRREKTGLHEEQLAYWESQLEGSQPLEFLCDKQRPAVLSGRAGWLPVKIDGSLYQDLHAFCRSRQVTPFSTLLAAFRATHFRLTGASDATIGIPAAARTHSELEDLIGYFGNVQCIRTKVESQDQTFSQLVDHVQSVTTAAFENQDVPFDQIVSKVLKERDLSRHPLAQVTFVLHPQTNFCQLQLEELQVEQLRLPQVSRLDLEVHLYPADDFIQGDIQYSVDLFDEKTMQGMLSVFYDVLREGLRQPDTDFGSLPFTDVYQSLGKQGLTSPELQAPSSEMSIIHMFHEQVAAHADEIAVRDMKGELTYSELDQRSSLLAAFLAKGCSFSSEAPVGVYAPRSCEGIVANFGIMKAGLTYVPLDVDAPVERIETILSCLPTCELVMMGSDQKPPAVSAPSVRFASIADSLSDVAAEELNEFLSASTPTYPTSRACILFTSGTTGKPKGVMMEQYGIVRLSKDPEIVAHVATSKVSSFLLNPVFDASGFDIYPALLNGGTLVCIDRQAAWDYSLMEEIFVKNEVRRAVMTPAILSQCLVSAPAILTGLNILYIGGDKLEPADVSKARRCNADLLILNCYGPTENSVISTRYAVPSHEVGVNGIPIGRSIHESGAYVMDRNMQLVPIGVLGELVVTGLGLARGYVNPEDDLNRFVTIDIDGHPVRAYRTGDLVRYRPVDAQMEFFGRMDQQVKIRGHRIEPGEIDNLLLIDDLVTSASTVLQKRDAQTEPELVSFVTVEEAGQRVASVEAQVLTTHVDSWRTKADSDDHYGGVNTIRPEALGRDFLGWVSMYSGEPIDETDMKEWLDDTIATIRQFEPKRVLEIGTGTGMIMFNLINRLDRYRGLDLSSQAVRFVQDAAGLVDGAAEKVNVQVGTAADLEVLKPAEPLDLAIINSVAQYFPSLDYLLKVILDLIHVQDPKCIFFGDVRSYALHAQFQASNVRHLYGHTLTAPQFRMRMAEVARSERELLVDPAFFTSLAEELPDLIAHVEILPKKMKVTNELSCYRYAAILHVNRPGRPPLDVQGVDESSWIDFERQGLNSESLARRLQTPECSDVLAVSNIPNRKTIEERFLLDALQFSKLATSDVGWSEQVCRQAQACPALAALDLVDLAHQTGWDVEISCARQGSQQGGLDAIFHRRASTRGPRRVLFRFPADHHAPGPIGVFGNNPLKLPRNHLVETHLLDTLRAKLPYYMVPRLVRVLEQMPVNNVGKVDRKALSQRNDISPLIASTTKSESASRREASSFANESERVLWEEFTDMLGVDVGINDSYFDLGGHSLMAIKLISRINKRLGSSLRVSDLFQYTTVARLGQLLQEFDSPPSNGVLIDTYKPFSLLSDSVSSPQDLTSLHWEEMQLPSGAVVVDIFPVTECQAWFLGDWSLVSHSFEIQGDLDLAGLESACQAAVRRHAVLRTVFTTLQGHPVQVVCQSVDVPFTQEATERLVESGCKVNNGEQALIPSRVTTRFNLTSRPGRNDYMFTLQLCHAQYDGPSLFTILSDITSLYQAPSSLPPTSTVSFSRYLQASRVSRANGSLDFWKEYLAGSSGLTAVCPSAIVETNDHSPHNTVQEASGALPPLSDVTFPTLVNAAIALCLGNLTKTQDVTFACVMSSRDVLATADPQAELVGPCINRTLLRVQLPEVDSTSALEFCRQLRDIQARAAGGGHLSLADVLESSTDWLPPSSGTLAAEKLLKETPFITHLPADTATPSFHLSEDLDVAWKSTDVRIDPGNQVLVRSTTSTVDNGMDACIQVQTSDTVLNSEDALALAAHILKMVQLLSVAPEVLVRDILLEKG